VILKSPVIRLSLDVTKLSATYLTVVGATRFLLIWINAGVNFYLKISTVGATGPNFLYSRPCRADHYDMASTESV